MLIFTSSDSMMTLVPRNATLGGVAGHVEVLRPSFTYDDGSEGEVGGGNKNTLPGF